MNIQNKKESIEAKLQSLGYSLASLSLKREQGQDVIAIVVDRVLPIDMNAIVELTHQLSPFFDEIDDGNEPYTLDISSLGAEKPLKIEDLKLYVGRYVHVHLINPIKGENIYEGTIKSVSADCLTLEYRLKTRAYQIDILFNNIYKVRLAIKF